MTQHENLNDAIEVTIGDGTELVLLAPTVLRVRPAEEVSRYFDGYNASCLELGVGEHGEVIPVVVSMLPADFEHFIRSAKAMKKHLLVWYGYPTLVLHSETGSVVAIGHVERLGG